MNNFQEVSIAGRIMSLQPKGKVCFMKIQDHLGRIQLYVGRDNVSPDEDKTFFDELVFNAMFQLSFLDHQRERVARQFH